MSARGQVGAVVGGGGPELAGQGHPAAGSQLVGVHPQAHAVGPGRGQHGPGLAHVEGARFAEHVAPSGRRRRRRDHGLREQSQVSVTIVAVLRRDQVGAQERRFGREGPGDVEVDGLVLGGEPVARLDFEGGGAGRQGLPDQTSGSCLQVRTGRGPGGRHRVENAARLIGASRHPQGELLGPITGEDQMGVAVHEARHHTAAVEVGPNVDVEGSARGRAGVHHPGVLDDHGGVLDERRGGPGRGRGRT